MNPDGTGRAQLTHNDIDENLSALSDVSPRWSPHGDRLLFQRGRSIPGLTALDGLYLANPDGTGEQLPSKPFRPTTAGARTATGSSSWPAPPPVWARASGTACSLPIPSRTDARRLDSPTTFVLSVDWSPDGSRIAIDDGQDIWTVPADGTGGTVPLVTGPGNNGGASWSPDGRRSRLHSATADGSSEIYRWMNADGTGQTSPDRNPARRDEGPVWAPDGTKTRSAVRVQHGPVVSDSHGGRRRHVRDAAHGNELDAGAFDGVRLAADPRPAAQRLQERGEVLQGGARVLGASGSGRNTAAARTHTGSAPAVALAEPGRSRPLTRFSHLVTSGSPRLGPGP